MSAAVGFAADGAGNGVAYVRLGVSASRVLRVPFQVKRYPGLSGREVGYAALTAVGIALRRRGVRNVEIAVDDERLAGDLLEHRDVPAPLTLAYVRLRCALNQLGEYGVASAAEPDADLTARARADVAMHAAA